MNLILVTSLLLSGCGLFEKRTVVQTEYIKQSIPIQTRPKGVTLNKLYFYVVTKDNLEEFISNFEKENGELVFYAISVRGYENLALNLAELRRYIQQQNEIIVYYENALSKDKKE